MRLEDFIEQTKDFPRDTIIVAYDAEEETVVPVTGLLFHTRDIPKVEICTDDNS